MHRDRCRPGAGFTLGELLVVMSLRGNSTGLGQNTGMLKEDKLKYRAAGKKVIEWLKAWKSTNIRSKSSWSGVSNLVMTL